MQKIFSVDPGVEKQRGSVWTLLFFVTLGVVMFGSFYAPAVYSDDWSSFVKPMVDGDVPWIDVTARRPLAYAPRRLLFELVGLNVPVSHIVLGVLNVVAAIQFYYLVARFFPKMPVVAFVAAAIFLVAPVDYTRTWLTMIHIRLAMCLLFQYAWFLGNFARTGRTLSLVGALCLLGLSLGMYEAQLGLAMVWCLWLAAVESRRAWRQKAAVLSPLVLGGIYMVWRTFGVARSGIADRYLGEIQLTPKVIAGRLVLGFKVLIWGWTEPLRRLFGFGGNWLPLIVLLFSIVLCWLVVILLFRWSARGYAPETYAVAHSFALRDLAILFAVGVVLAAVGYLPIALLYEPTLDGLASRVNTFALPGAALALTALLCGGAYVLARRRQHMQTLALAGLVPLVILGAGTQIWVQHDIRTAWREQTRIWADFFALVPDLADETTVCFVFRGYQDRAGFVNWQRTPLSSNWEVTAALQTLYGNDSLHGELFFLDVKIYGETILTQEGIVDFWTDVLIPYERVLFVLYAEKTGHLEILRDPVSVLPMTWALPTYAPDARIASRPTQETQWRWLVDPGNAVVGR